MINVLLDGRIDTTDGIGRYTRCLVAGLKARAGDTAQIHVLEPTNTPRYGHREGAEVIAAAEACDADVVHLLDYRIPLEPTTPELVVTVHDLLRLARPEHCYSDKAFRGRFGNDGMTALAGAVNELRELIGFPDGAVRASASLHEEFYARMLALACDRANQVMTPTAVVAGQVAALLGREAGVWVSPYGLDHTPMSACSPTGGVPHGRYLLYVGQARTHKGLPYLRASFARSRAMREGVRLIFVGKDFEPASPVADSLVAEFGAAVQMLGAVSDVHLRATYAGAEALLHLSEHEGFGFTPLEALKAGTRVLASDIGVLRETLGTHATFVEPTDPDAVAAAIDQLIAEADTPGQRAVRSAWAGRYRWRHHVDDVLTAYAEAAG
ncbi:MAG: glycosyltransferase [Nocardioides sp.]